MSIRKGGARTIIISTRHFTRRFQVEHRLWNPIALILQVVENIGQSWNGDLSYCNIYHFTSTYVLYLALRPRSSPQKAKPALRIIK
jgi:hypothetical protein